MYTTVLCPRITGLGEMVHDAARGCGAGFTVAEQELDACRLWLSVTVMLDVYVPVWEGVTFMDDVLPRFTELIE